jgi:hypothetical protein
MNGGGIPVNLNGFYTIPYSKYIDIDTQLSIIVRKYKDQCIKYNDLYIKYKKCKSNSKKNEYKELKKEHEKLKEDYAELKKRIS